MADQLAARVASVRSFNRFYTKVIGTLSERLLDSPYTLAEVRVLFELAQRDSTPVAGLRKALDLDAGYLSRILGRFTSDGLVTRARAEHDGRQQVLALTQAGRSVFADIDMRSAAHIGELIGGLSDSQQRRLTEAMRTIESLLGAERRPEPVVIRAARVGDYGWIIERHGALYSREHGFDASFEAYVARVIADHVEHHDPKREAGWVAEVGGERAGCVLCVRRDDEAAQLRVLLVEPSARGKGIGSRLVDECLRFAREVGYRRIVLSTNSGLHAARRIYQRAGFKLAGAGAPESGHEIVDQEWSMAL